MNTIDANSNGLLPLSEAADRLAQGMWGGVRRAAPVQAIKQSQKKLSVGFGPWQEKAKRRIRGAAATGELTVYVLAASNTARNELNRSHCSADKSSPMPVPVAVLERMITSRGSLPDYPARTSVQMTKGDMTLLWLLTNGLLVVGKTDFETWYRLERAKGKWPSQSARLKPSRGRPRKQSTEVRHAIARLVRDNAWSANHGIPALRRILIQSGRTEVPSVYTLKRAVTELFIETGDTAFRRPRKPRSSGPKANRAKIASERRSLVVRK